MDDRSKKSMLFWAGAAVVTLAGAITLAIGLFTPVGLGWFAYQPLANATFTPAGSAVMLSRVTIAGWLLLFVGMLALSFLAWRLLGQRSSK